MQKSAREEDITVVEKILSNQGIHSERLIGEKQTVVGIIGASHGIDISAFSSLQGVQEVVRVNSPIKLASRGVHPDDTVITFSDGTRIGGDAPSVVIAGPCSVESEDQLRRTAELIMQCLRAWYAAACDRQSYLSEVIGIRPGWTLASQI